MVIIARISSFGLIRPKSMLESDWKPVANSEKKSGWKYAKTNYNRFKCKGISTKYSIHYIILSSFKVIISYLFFARAYLYN